MSIAQGLIKKVDAVLKRFSPPEGTVYKRTITSTGDELIGRNADIFADVVMSPQPYFSRLGRERLYGQHAKAETLLDASGKALLADDWEFLFSPNAMPRADLQNPAIQVVVKDSSGNTESFRLLDFESSQISDTDVLYVAYMRSVQRP